MLPIANFSEEEGTVTIFAVACSGLPRRARARGRRAQLALLGDLLERWASRRASFYHPKWFAALAASNKAFAGSITLRSDSRSALATAQQRGPRRRRSAWVWHDHAAGVSPLLQQRIPTAA